MCSLAIVLKSCVLKTDILGAPEGVLLKESPPKGFKKDAIHFIPKIDFYKMSSPGGRWHAARRDG